MDVDIDLPPKFDPKTIFRTVIRASRVDSETKELEPHNVGYYFQDIPQDVVTGLAAIPYTESEQYGYLKIDMLTVNLLPYFDSKAEMRRLQKMEPDWTMLQDPKIVPHLFHLGKHYDTLSRVKPMSIDELADVFALIRPNKIALIDKYVKNPVKYREELFTKTDASDMRRAHALPYAIMIVLQLHLIEQGRYEITDINTERASTES